MTSLTSHCILISSVSQHLYMTLYISLVRLWVHVCAISYIHACGGRWGTASLDNECGRGCRQCIEDCSQTKSLCHTSISKRAIQAEPLLNSNPDNSVHCSQESQAQPSYCTRPRARPTHWEQSGIWLWSFFSRMDHQQRELLLIHIKIMPQSYKA